MAANLFEKLSEMFSSLKADDGDDEEEEEEEEEVSLLDSFITELDICLMFFSCHAIILHLVELLIF